MLDVEYNPKIAGQTAIVNSVILAFFELRNRASKKHFGKSYLEIYQPYGVTQTKSDWDKLSELKVLHPIQLLDKPYLRRYNLHFVYEEIGPPVLKKK